MGPRGAQSPKLEAEGSRPTNMSVDIAYLSAHLPERQRAAVQAEYERNAKSPTTAFLLCFFLGAFGAHRFYLGQTAAGVVRLVLSPLVIPTIIWEIVDLFRIDADVATSNQTLAGRLIARAALAAPGPGVAAAVARLNEMQSQPLVRADGAAAVADAPHVEVTATTPISGDPTAQAHPVITTREVDERDAAPIWPVVDGAEAAAATATEPVAFEAESGEPATSEEPDLPLPATADMDITPEMVAFAAATAAAAAPLVVERHTTAPEELTEEAPAVQAEEMSATETSVSPSLAHGGDPTDRATDTGSLPVVADLGEASGVRVVVRLLDEDVDEDALPVAPGTAVDWTDTAPMQAVRVAEIAEGAEVAPTAEDVLAPAVENDGPQADEMSTLVLVPGDQPAEPVEAEMMAEPAVPADETPAADALLAGLGAVAGMGALEMAEAHAEPPPEPPEPSAPAPESRGSYESAVTEDLHDHMTDTGSHRIVKRVKVVRRLVVNGKVVEEATAEQVVDANADTSATARSLQESLGSGNVQQRIASLSTPVAPPPPDTANASEGQPDTATAAEE